MTENTIEVCHLTKRFGNLVAVDDISFTVKKGELFGLVGPNGAGKSTTIKMLTGLTRPTHGVIHIRGYNLRQKKGQVLKIIGVLPEDVELYQDVTGRDMLDHPSAEILQFNVTVLTDNNLTINGFLIDRITIQSPLPLPGQECHCFRLLHRVGWVRDIFFLCDQQNKRQAIELLRHRLRGKVDRRLQARRFRLPG